jgi:hypothetical protein
MSNAWYSLYLRSENPSEVSDTLQSVFQNLGWTPYDPFPGGVGTPFSLKIFAKAFVLPADTSLIRVVSEAAFPEEILFSLSELQPILFGWLTASDGGWQAIHEAVARAAPDAFAPFLKPEASPETVARAIKGDVPVPTAEQPSNLPPDVEKLAQKVNPKQAEKLAERMSGGIFDRLGGGSSKSEAQAFLKGGIDWNSDAGRKVRALASVFALPTNWREPSYVQAKDAYQAARALARNPKATLTAGEQDARRALPNASDFKPIFMGKPG